MATKKAMAIVPKVIAILLFAVVIFSMIVGYLTVGGVSKVWKGAGDGIVHSKPCAPSQA